MEPHRKVTHAVSALFLDLSASSAAPGSNRKVSPDFHRFQHFLRDSQTFLNQLCDLYIFRVPNSHPIHQIVACWNDSLLYFQKIFLKCASVDTFSTTPCTMHWFTKFTLHTWRMSVMRWGINQNHIRLVGCCVKKECQGKLKFSEGVC